MNETVRVACLGAGYWGKNLVRNLHQLGALTCICDVELERQQQLANEYPGVRITDSTAAVLADPEIDAVVIATPAETHGRLVRAALDAGKDVFVEKPLCLSLLEGRQLAQQAEAAGRVLMVGHLLHYHPAVIKLQELVVAGELGRIQYIYSNRLNLGLIRREENILWSFAPHDISVMLALVGAMPETVTAHGGSYLRPEIADVTVSLLSFPGGVKTHIFVSWLHPFKEQKLVVVGDRKMAVFNDGDDHDKLLLFPHTIEWKGELPVARKAEAQPVPYDWSEPLRAECAHFLDCVARRRTPRTDGWEALRVLTVLEACERSLRGRESVRVGAEHLG